MMKESIDCFLPCRDFQLLFPLVSALRQQPSVAHVHLLVDDEFSAASVEASGCICVPAGRCPDFCGLQLIDSHTDADYVMLGLSTEPFRLRPFAVERLLSEAHNSQAALLYADYYLTEGSRHTLCQLPDYQPGSLREDFCFGPFVLVRSALLHEYVVSTPTNYHSASLYALRLFLSRRGAVVHVAEALSYFTLAPFCGAASQDAADRLAYGEALREHLRSIGADVRQEQLREPDFETGDFDYEASVVIPVRNRRSVIAQAVKSALVQRTTFRYNVIVVDNHSTDGTSQVLADLSRSDSRVIVITPPELDLGIGGCWNWAVADARCGRFAVQLDSDDTYASPTVLQSIVDAFHSTHAAMVVGTYCNCDAQLRPFPDGMMRHSEWTSEQGADALLRMNGIGAPRAFFTPLLRDIPFPDISYGEDYAEALAISRSWRVARFNDCLYLRRCWEGNVTRKTDDGERLARAAFKDRLRTLELLARRTQNEQAPEANDGGLAHFFHKQLEQWPEVRQRYRDLCHLETRDLNCGVVTLRAQFNPDRIVSTEAHTDSRSVARRPCFLCEKNRPQEQLASGIDTRFSIMVNPFPVLPVHFTVVARHHQPQRIWGNYGEIHRLLLLHPDLLVFYNGPRCGASAPDHLHFQAATGAELPLQAAWPRLSRDAGQLVALNDSESLSIIRSYPCPLFVIRSHSEESDEELFCRLYRALPLRPGDVEPMMNILAWRAGADWITVVVPRSKHRPDCFSREQETLKVSPGALDMGGLIILPHKDDFSRITPAQASAIIGEVGLPHNEITAIMDKIKNPAPEACDLGHPLSLHHEPTVSVGIVSGSEVHFTLNAAYEAKGTDVTGSQVVSFADGAISWQGNLYRELVFHPHVDSASFSISDVTIGVNFHWERKETQTFLGALHFVVEEGKVCAINELPVESYLESVVSSEMRATAGLEFLKAHAVISRSWLLAQMEKRRKAEGASNGFFSFTRKDDELIRWYDREDHTIFDVCADDHCQRYQGITKETSPIAAEAVRQTRGQVLFDGSDICDARFSKCCGGITEEFQYCWEDTPKPYLRAVADNGEGSLPDLTVEANAEKWIRSNPPAYCNTHDHKVLAQVLNDYDLETADFYRWQVDYTQEQVAALLLEKLKLDFGQVLSLIPLERGRSGRISRLKIVGSKLTFTIGKELEIRRALSKSHLYSSAFVVDALNVDSSGVPGRFRLIGAGWGHGVGLCQIGAAVMGARGFKHDAILHHYYVGAQIKKLY